MMHNVNLRLIAATKIAVFVLFLLGGALPAHAQDSPAEPVPEVMGEALDTPIADNSAAVPIESAPVLLELFSTQACFFCPQAERLFADLIKQKNILGLSCHVDYFDVKKNALSHSFCTARQKKYMEQLKAGPQYTPQIIVNGRIDVVGHKFEDIQKAMHLAALNAPTSIVISKVEGDNYSAALPAIDNPQNRPIDLWLALYDKPHELSVAEGRNRGKKLTFYNIVDDLRNIGRWDGAAQDKILSAVLKDTHKGVALIAQDAESGEVLAFGRYRKAALQKP